MARMDWDAMRQPDFEPGCYKVEVAEAEEKTSRRGDPYFNLKLLALDFGRSTLCYDIIMLAGKGARIGYTKLIELGMSEDQDEVLAAELVGKRAFVWVAHETYEGKVRLKVFVDAHGSACGYLSIDSPPADYVRPEVGSEPQGAETMEADGTPF